jgi:predicted Ser/Thr protein kinase
MHLCEKHGLEAEAVAAQVKTNKEFRGKLQAEAKTLRLLKPETAKNRRRKA